MNYDYLVVGGGVLGQATAWRLANQCGSSASIGLVTSDALCEGTTSQAAALVTYGRSHAVATDMVKDTMEAVSKLDSDLSLGLPFHKCGGLHLAFNDIETKALQNMAETAKSADIDFQWLSEQEVKQKVSEFNVKDIQSALWFEDDGFIDPVLLANAYGSIAKANGVRFHLNSKVTELTIRSDEQLGDALSNVISGVKLSSGEIITASHVILCAGPWTAKLLKSLDCTLPVALIRSLYWISENTELSTDFPVVIVPSVSSYFRKENQAMLFGVRDCPGVSLSPDIVPEDIQGFAFPEDKDGFDALIKAWPKLVEFWPGIEHLGLAHFINGISSYSPDGLPVIGTPLSNSGKLKNLTVVTGCSGAGIAYSGGIAKYAVEHALTGHVPHEISMSRFSHSVNNEAQSMQHCAYDVLFQEYCLQTRYNKKVG